MQIQVLGSGCKKCKELHERTQKSVLSLGLNVQVEYITDIQKIIQMGLMQSPVLVIDGEPLIVGMLPEVEKIKELLKAKLQK